MTNAPDTIHPIAAWHAIRALVRDREDTRQVFLLMDALRAARPACGNSRASAGR